MESDSRLKRMVKEKSKLLRAVLFFYNHLPFNNKIKKKGNRLQVGISFLKKTKIEFHGTGNTVIIGDGCRLTNCHIIIQGNNNTVRLSDFITAYQAEFYIEDDDNSILCDQHNLFAGKIHLACTEGSKIQIGKDCLFSSEIVIRTGDSHSVLDMEGNRINYAKDVIICDHVWVGYRALINKGVTVQKDSIIGTGAVVTKKFEQPNVCIAGSPAKVVKENVSWDIQRIGEGKK